MVIRNVRIYISSDLSRSMLSESLFIRRKPAIHIPAIELPHTMNDYTPSIKHKRSALLHEELAVNGGDPP